MQLLLAVVHAHTVPRIYNPDQRIRLLEVVAPVGSECSLASDIP